MDRCRRGLSSQRRSDPPNMSKTETTNPFMPTVAFNICCPRDCVSRHNDGGTAGAPFKPLRDDSALRALSSLRGLRGAPAVPPLCRETQSLGQQMLNATVWYSFKMLITQKICAWFLFRSTMRMQIY